MYLDTYTIDEYKKVFFDFLLKTPEILNQNYISVDLMPDYIDDNSKVTQELEQEIRLLRTHPDIIAYTRTGYTMEIRMVRYLTILVAEWTIIKRDIKLYQLNII
jgi:hypothetical protein